MKRAHSLAAVGLSISLFIYLFYRCKTTVVNELATLLLPSDVYTQIRLMIRETLPLAKPLIFSLPGGLWIYCMTILSRDFYLTIRNHKLQMAVVPFAFVVGLEFFQLFHFTRGTFDPWDLASYFVFWMLGYYGHKTADLPQSRLSPFTWKGFICLSCFLSVYLAHVNS